MKKLAVGDPGSKMPVAYGVFGPLPGRARAERLPKVPEHADLGMITCGDASTAEIPSEGRAFLLVNEDF